MSEDFQIRQANISDLAGICTVEGASFKSDQYPQFLLERLIRDTKSVFFILTEERGRIVGYCVSKIDGPSAHLISLAVLPKYRRLGAAITLLGRMLSVLRERNVGEVSLEVRTDNEPAIRLYVRAGFTKEEIIHDYYSDGSAALRMRKIWTWSVDSTFST